MVCISASGSSFSLWWKLWTDFLTELEFKLLVRAGQQHITRTGKRPKKPLEVPVGGEGGMQMSDLFAGLWVMVGLWAENGHCGRFRAFVLRSHSETPSGMMGAEGNFEMTGPCQSFNRLGKWELEKSGDLYPRCLLTSAGPGVQHPASPCQSVVSLFNHPVLSNKLII